MLSSLQKDLEKAIDVADAAVHDILASQSPAVRQLELALRELGLAVAPHYAARMVLTITLIDAVKTQTLPIPIAIYQTDGNRTPKDVTEDPSPQRFLLGAVDITVPRGTCPQCWSSWSGVRDGEPCVQCGLALGDECKVVVTADSCPSCDEGILDPDSARCRTCGWHHVPTKSIFLV